MNVPIALGFLFFSFFLYRYQKEINALTQQKVTVLLNFFIVKQILPSETQAKFISHLLSYIKGGYSLEEAKRKSLALFSKHEKEILESKNSITEKFYQTALASGCKVNQIFSLLKKSLDQESRFKKSILSISSQITLQVWIICFIPIFLFAALIIIDYSWINECLRNNTSLALFSASISLTAFSFFWISKIKSNFLEKDKSSQIKLFPNLILNTVLYLSSGTDAETAHQKSFIEQKTEFQFYFKSEHISDDYFNNIRSQYLNLLNNSIKYGSPISQDLFQLIDDIYFHIQLTAEENIKKLPIHLLTPLFICSFPSCAFVLMGLIYPKLSGL
ncbi:MAG: hypothetical protein M9962_11845 [Oligoflexia bacterium]|nr:hypothetical protein [Oligoflexia bacterium]